MKRVPHMRTILWVNLAVIVTTVLLIFASPLARAAYANGWTHPSCSSGHGVIGADLTVGAQKTLLPAVSSQVVPLIELEWSADAIANAPLVIAVTDGLMPTAGTNATSEGYWAGGSIPTYVKTWVTFKAYKNVSGSFTPTTIYTVNFTTQTLSTSNADLGFSDVSWYGSLTTLPSTQLYLLADQSNRTGSAANFGATIGRTTCTGGNPDDTIRFGGGVGVVNSDWDLSMLYYDPGLPSGSGGLFGDNGGLLGNPAENAQAWFGSSSQSAITAYKFMLGLLLFLAIVGPTGAFYGVAGGLIAAVGAIILLAAVGWWPAWLVAFLGILALAAFYLTRSGGGEA